jgi:fatty-acyl-CoA synthase
MRFSYRGLRFVNTAALPLDRELAQRTEEVFGCPATEHIGMTETAGPMNVSVPPQTVKRGSVGPPVPGLEERVVDPDTGAELGPGMVGELQVRGPMVTVGYWNNPEANRAAAERAGAVHQSDLVDPRLWSDAQIKNRVDAFFEALAAHKAAAGR